MIKHKFFFIPYFIFILVGAIVLLLFDKESLHLFFDQHHRPWLDLIAPWVTFLGDGWFSVILAVAFLFFSSRKAITLGLAYGSSSIVVQVLKLYVFNLHYRPVKFFDGMATLHLIPGVEMNTLYSFPSGHSTSAFALCCCLAYFTQKDWMKLLLLLSALFISFSRIYLNQHFFEDVYLGAIIGVGFAFLTNFFMEQYFAQKA